MDEPRQPRTRPLTLAERALLDHLLVPEFAGVASLRQQAARAEVVIQDEFPWFIELHVPPDAPPARDVYRNPITHTGTNDPTRLGADITLWLDGDYLSRVEVMWYDAEWPELPEDVPLAVEFRRRSRRDGQAVRTIAASLVEV